WDRRRRLPRRALHRALLGHRRARRLGGPVDRVARRERSRGAVPAAGLIGRRSGGCARGTTRGGARSGRGSAMRSVGLWCDVEAMTIGRRAALLDGYLAQVARAVRDRSIGL